MGGTVDVQVCGEIRKFHPFMGGTVDVVNDFHELYEFHETFMIFTIFPLFSVSLLSYFIFILILLRLDKEPSLFFPLAV